ncbi:MAG: outer membrane protein assembly factor BamE [Nitrospinota bacterium]|nr:outer membrane protein assembly factor BamE [Nitrospinota bacterium]
MIRNILLVAAAIAFSYMLSIMLMGCATDRLALHEKAAISDSKILKIQKGRSTREEIRGIFGEPFDTVTLNGKESWFYKDINLKPLYLEFDKNGVVSDFESNGKDSVPETD